MKAKSKSKLTMGFIVSVLSMQVGANLKELRKEQAKDTAPVEYQEMIVDECIGIVETSEIIKTYFKDAGVKNRATHNKIYPYLKGVNFKQKYLDLYEIQDDKEELKYLYKVLSIKELFYNKKGEIIRGQNKEPFIDKCIDGHYDKFF